MIGQLRIDGRCNCHLTGSTDDKGVAVGGLAHGIFDRKPATGTGLIFDDHGLTNILGELCPTSRAKRSFPPPAANPTTM